MVFHRSLLRWVGRPLPVSARIATIGPRLYQYKLSGYSGICYTCLISGPIFAAHPAPFFVVSAVSA
ncbi:hypothetical protein FFI87_012585 [Burkholderia sp. KBS0801]|nr:hypothetical protein FFI87_012585 [Burkholderia sp. KBS0801]